jgi:uncharacterized membrane protein YuzA (DUF378 family)
MMKALRRNPANILAAALLSFGVLGLGFLGLARFDLVSEPFGVLMVLSRGMSSAAVLGALYHWTTQKDLPRGYVRVRA